MYVNTSFQGAIEAIVYKICNSERRNYIKRLCTFALQNIAAHSTARDYLLGENVLPILLRDLGIETESYALETIWQIIHLLCQWGDSPPPLDLILPAAPFLQELLTSNHANTLCNACNIVGAFLKVEGFPERKKMEFVKNVVKILETHSRESVPSYALPIISHFAAGSESETEIVIRCGGIGIIKRLLEECPHIDIKQQVCYIFSNIMCVTAEQVEQLEKAGVIESMVSCLHHDSPLIRTEAAWAIGNLMQNGTLPQIQRAVEMGGIHAMCKLLKDPSEMTIEVTIEGFIHFLKQGEALKEDRNPHILAIEAISGDFYESLSNMPHLKNAK